MTFKITTNLYLIRHGEAHSNVTPVIGGMRGDKGLTPLGVEQAERLRDRLKISREIKADLFIASDLPRARQTAEIIAPAIGRPITWDPEFQEMRVGEADGITVEELKTRYGIPDFQRYPFRPIAVNGENWPQFMLRVGTAIDRVVREHAGQTIVVVCHGGVIDGSFQYFFGLNTLAGPRIEFFPHNTSITHWQHRQRSNGDLVWRLVSYNDVLHLHDIGARDPQLWEDMATEPDTGSDKLSVPIEQSDQG